ncbi:MAG TPA: 2-phospho-L-lactate guanylyltransferase [Jatrophihabitans sp.]|nr:2-phospho-L-lactate guanylyltransferase [Jatrophihabitans sp.]
MIRWTVVIPAKALPAAKSRLLPASDDAESHRWLVESIRSDTLAAARAAEATARVLVVTDLPGLADAIVQTRPGLNAALIEAADYAARTWPDDGVAALVGDLPALLPEQLTAALTEAAQHPRSFVADAAGSGTTLLTARPGIALDPAFGEGSAARHASAAVPLPAAQGLRCDVDTADDLRAAAELGVGPATSVALARASGLPIRLPVHIDAASWLHE